MARHGQLMVQFGTHLHSRLRVLRSSTSRCQKSKSVPLENNTNATRLARSKERGRAYQPCYGHAKEDMCVGVDRLPLKSIALCRGRVPDRKQKCGTKVGRGGRKRAP